MRSWGLFKSFSKSLLIDLLLISCRSTWIPGRHVFHWSHLAKLSDMCYRNLLTVDGATYAELPNILIPIFGATAWDVFVPQSFDGAIGYMRSYCKSSYCEVRSSGFSIPRLNRSWKRERRTKSGTHPSTSHTGMPLSYPKAFYNAPSTKKYVTKITKYQPVCGIGV